jgi:hypothetical protein
MPASTPSQLKAAAQVLLHVYNCFLASPFLCQGSPHRGISKAEWRELRESRGEDTTLFFTESACSLSRHLRQVRGLMSIPSEVETLATGYLWAAIAAIPPMWPANPVPGVATVLDRFNDQIVDLQQMEDMLVGAYLLALSEADPPEEFSTLEQVTWQNKYIEMLESAGGSESSTESIGVCVVSAETLIFWSTTLAALPVPKNASLAVRRYDSLNGMTKALKNTAKPQ